MKRKPDYSKWRLKITLEWVWAEGVGKQCSWCRGKGQVPDQSSPYPEDMVDCPKCYGARVIGPGFNTAPDLPEGLMAAIIRLADSWPHYPPKQLSLIEEKQDAAPSKD